MADIDPAAAAGAQLDSSRAMVLDRINSEAGRANDRQGALDTARDASLDERNATLGPMEARASQNMGELASLAGRPMPPRTADQLTPPTGPIIDKKDYEGFSWALIGMALMGGAASKGNWLGVSSTLNGALKGYLEGNQQKAQKEYDDFQRKYAAAKAHDDAALEEFQDILSNKNLSINAQLKQVEIAAAKYGRDDIRFEAQQKSIDGIWKGVDSLAKSLTGVDQRMLSVQKQVDQRREANAGKNAQTISNDEVNLVAEEIIAGSKSAQSIVGAYDKGDRAAIGNRVGQMAKERGLHGADLVAAQNMLTSEGRVETSTMIRKAAVQRLGDSVKSLGPQLQEAARKGTANIGSKWANTKAQDLKRQFNDPSVNDLEVLVREIGVQFQEAMTMPGSNAQMHEGAREVANELLNSNMDYKQLMHVYQTMSKIIDTNHGALTRIVEDIDKQTRAGNQPGKPVSLDEYLKSQGH